MRRSRSEYISALLQGGTEGERGETRWKREEGDENRERKETQTLNQETMACVCVCVCVCVFVCVITFCASVSLLATGEALCIGLRDAERDGETDREGGRDR